MGRTKQKIVIQEPELPLGYYPELEAVGLAKKYLACCEFVFDSSGHGDFIWRKKPLKIDLSDIDPAFVIGAIVNLIANQSGKDYIFSYYLLIDASHCLTFMRDLKGKFYCLQERLIQKRKQYGLDDKDAVPKSETEPDSNPNAKRIRTK